MGGAKSGKRGKQGKAKGSKAPTDPKPKESPEEAPTGRAARRRYLTTPHSAALLRRTRRDDESMEYPQGPCAQDPWFIWWDGCGVSCFLFGQGVVWYANALTTFVVLPLLFGPRNADGSGGEVPLPIVGMGPWQLFHTVVFECIIALVVGAHFMAATTRPGHTRKGSAQQGDAMSLYAWMLPREMDHGCRALKPSRHHHCRICDHCVSKMDHHCPWINNCLGQNNHKFFLQFCFYVLVGCTYAGILALCLAWRCVAAGAMAGLSGPSGRGRARFSSRSLPKVTDPSCADLSPVLVIMLVVSVVLELFFAIFVTAMLCDQSDALATDTTGIESMKRWPMRQQATPPGRHTPPHARPGLWAGLHRALGSEFGIKWFLPVTIDPQFAYQWRHGEGDAAVRDEEIEEGEDGTRPEPVGRDPLADVTGVDEGCILDVIDSREPRYRNHCDDLERQVENWARECEAKEAALRAAMGRAAGDVLTTREFDPSHESFEWEYERRVVKEVLEPLPETVAPAEMRRAFFEMGRTVTETDLDDECAAKLREARAKFEDKWERCPDLLKGSITEVLPSAVQPKKDEDEQDGKKKKKKNKKGEDEAPKPTRRTRRRYADWEELPGVYVLEATDGQPIKEGEELHDEDEKDEEGRRRPRVWVIDPEALPYGRNPRTGSLSPWLGWVRVRRAVFIPDGEVQSIAGGTQLQACQLWRELRRVFGKYNSLDAKMRDVQQDPAAAARLRRAQAQMEPQQGTGQGERV